MMAALAYAFLLTLMSEEQRPLRIWLLNHYCHRRGHKARLVHLPLYRLRLALSRLWQRSPPRFELLGIRRIA
jgi:hypothetical protein